MSAANAPQPLTGALHCACGRPEDYDRERLTRRYSEWLLASGLGILCGCNTCRIWHIVASEGQTALPHLSNLVVAIVSRRSACPIPEPRKLLSCCHGSCSASLSAALSLLP